MVGKNMVEEKDGEVERIKDRGKWVKVCEECGATESDNGVKIDKTGICNFCKMEREE